MFLRTISVSYTHLDVYKRQVFDSRTWDKVVGTLSGDDTFFILMRSEEAAADICRQLQQYTAHRT